MHRIRDVERTVEAIGACDTVSGARITSISLGTGLAAAQLELPRSLFYDTLSEQSALPSGTTWDLLELLSSLARVKAEYDKVSGALEEVKATGYGIVVPSTDELVLEEPEIVKQGGRYGVRLKASAPSIHIMRYKQKCKNHKPTEADDILCRMVCGTVKGGPVAEYNLQRANFLLDIDFLII